MYTQNYFFQFNEKQLSRMNGKQIDDLFFAGLLGVTIIGGLLAAFRAQVGDLAPIFIWSVNCGLIYLAGTIIEG